MAGCVAAIARIGIHAHDAAGAVGAKETPGVQARSEAGKPGTEFATATRLPSLSSNSEALGVNDPVKDVGPRPIA